MPVRTVARLWPLFLGLSLIGLAVTALASVTILIHASFVEPWTWAAMRLLTGFAFSAIYVIAGRSSGDGQ